MTNFPGRVLAAFGIVTCTSALLGIGVGLSNDEETKATDIGNLREAVSAAAKRGDNVAEIRAALEAFEKSLAKGWTAPEAGKTVEPSPELQALRDAVEAAARKGENVEEIRTQLSIVEKALTGKVLVKPKPLPPPNMTAPEVPRGQVGPGIFPIQPRIFPQQVNPGGDADGIQKAQAAIQKATEMLLKNPDDAEALRMMQQAQEMLLRAMLAGQGGFGPAMRGDIGGRIPERFRLGVRLERISELAADQLGLEVARGVGIAGVVEGSAAEKAGFKTHDIVLEFGGKPVTDNPDDFTRQVTEVKPGEKVDAVILRKGKKVEIKGIAMPDAPQAIGRALPQEPNLLEIRPAIRPNVGGDAIGRGGNSVSYSNVNGQLTINAVQDGVNYKISATRDGNATEMTKATITDGDSKIEADKLDKVPEKYRAFVERLLKGGQPRVRP